MKQVFARDELAAAFESFEQTVARAAETKNWDDWVQQYTPDVDYIEHAAGTMKGREQVLTWIRKTMTTFPGSHMTAFPSLWSVIDEPTARIICELDNPMVDPGDGTIISATNISISVNPRALLRFLLRRSTGAGVLIMADSRYSNSKGSTDSWDSLDSSG